MSSTRRHLLSQILAIFALRQSISMQTPKFSYTAQDHTYGSLHDHQTFRMFQPIKKLGGPGTPAVIFMTGGGWGKTTKLSEPGPLGMAFLKRGIAFIDAQFGYLPGAIGKFPGPENDAVVLARYLQRNAFKLGIDKERIGAAGRSAGGQNLMYYAWHPDANCPAPKFLCLSAVAAVYLPSMQQNVSGSLGQHYGPGNTLAALSSQDQIARSPITWITTNQARASQVPVFLAAGEMTVDFNVKPLGPPYPTDVVEHNHDSWNANQLHKTLSTIGGRAANFTQFWWDKHPVDFTTEEAWEAQAAWAASII